MEFERKVRLADKDATVVVTHKAGQATLGVFSGCDSEVQVTAEEAKFIGRSLLLAAEVMNEREARGD